MNQRNRYGTVQQCARTFAQGFLSFFRYSLLISLILYIIFTMSFRVADNRPRGRLQYCAAVAASVPHCW